MTGLIEVNVYDHTSTLSEAAAGIVVAAAQAAAAERGRFLVALSGGSTPAGLFHLLAQTPYVDQIPWKQSHIFWGDERLVPPDDPGSNYGQVAQILLDHLSLPAENIHRAKGELDSASAVADYSTQLRQLAEVGRRWPRFDLAIMGLGSDGHTASLFPGPIAETEKHDPVIAVTAEYDGRPAHRISLTPLLFNDARHILFLVTGNNKAAAVTAVIHGQRQPEKWPAQRIKPHDGRLTWFIDKAAAAKMPPSLPAVKHDM